MKKKGFTLVELAIAIALLMTIMAAVGAIFSVVIKTYQIESQRGFFQKELNFFGDSITRDIKQSQVVQDYGPHTLSASKLILSLPSIDEQNQFIYAGNDLKTDTVVYYRDGSDFYKILYPDPASKRANGITGGSQTTHLAGNISNLNFTYSPNITAARQVTFSITLTKTLGKRTVTLTASDTADLRNKQ